MKTEDDLERAIEKLENSVKKYHNRQMGIVEEVVVKEPPVFTLLDRPDSELNEEELKEKRKQRLLKSGYDARERIRQEKEQIRLHQVLKRLHL